MVIKKCGSRNGICKTLLCTSPSCLMNSRDGKRDRNTFRLTRPNIETERCWWRRIRASRSRCWSNIDIFKILITDSGDVLAIAFNLNTQKFRSTRNPSKDSITSGKIDPFLMALWVGTQLLVVIGKFSRKVGIPFPIMIWYFCTCGPFQDKRSKYSWEYSTEAGIQDRAGPSSWSWAREECYTQAPTQVLLGKFLHEGN
jgi:hypothetical protein